MGSQLYEGLVSEYSENVSNEEEFIPIEDVKGIHDALEQKTDTTQVFTEDIQIDIRGEGVYKVTVEDLEGSFKYIDGTPVPPENELKTDSWGHNPSVSSNTGKTDTTQA